MDKTLRRIVALEFRIRRFLRGLFLDPTVCRHPVQIHARQYPTGPMGLRCFSCRRWLGALNISFPATRVCIELEARQTIARMSREAREGVKRTPSQIADEQMRKAEQIRRRVTAARYN